MPDHNWPSVPPPPDPAVIARASRPELADPDAERAARARLTAAITAEREAAATARADADAMERAAAVLAETRRAYESRFAGTHARIAKLRADGIRAGGDGALPDEVIAERRARTEAESDLRELEEARTLLSQRAAASDTAAKEAAERVTEATNVVLCHQIAKLLDQRRALLAQVAALDEPLLCVNVGEPRDPIASRVVSALRAEMAAKARAEMGRARPAASARWRTFRTALQSDAEAQFPDAT